MIKKLQILTAFMLSTAGCFAQQATVELYKEAVDELGFSWHSDNGGSTTKFARVSESTTGSCGGGDQYEFDYASEPETSPGNGGYWAGNGAFNINDWGFGAVQDYSNHTHLKISYRWSGSSHSTGNTLMFSFVDSTLTGPSTYKEGKADTVALASLGSSGCVTTYIPLDSFVGTAISGKDIDLSNLQGINWSIGGIAWNSDPLLVGAADGTFFIDDIEIVDYTAPAITSLSANSGPVGSVITLTGTNFLNVDDVSFNGTSATTFTVVNSTTIDVTVPTGATDGTITVSNPVNSGTSANSFDVTVSTGISAKNNLNVTIGPNPSEGVFILSSTDQIDEIIITDYLGNVISKSNTNRIDLSNNSDGLYFATIVSGEKISIEKLIKE